MFKQREGALCRIFAPRSRTHLLGPRDTSLPSERGSGPRRGYPEGGGRTGLPKVLRGGYCASGTRSNWRQKRNCCLRRARVQPTHCACSVSNDAHHLRLGNLLIMNMSDWKILYRDRLDQDRVSRSIPSKEAALKQASDLYRQQRAELYGIEGPNGLALPKEEIMRWMSTNKW